MEGRLQGAVAAQLPPPPLERPVSLSAAPPCCPSSLSQRKIREDPEISNAVAGGIAGEAW